MSRSKSPAGLMASVVSTRARPGNTPTHQAVLRYTCPSCIIAHQAIYVDKAEVGRPYQMVSSVGMSIPLHCTAIGKAILSALPLAESRSLLSSVKFEQRTQRTLTSAAEVLADLEGSRTPRTRYGGHND
jgi:DNA-binding IclR family transcriptional regulator